MDMRARLSPPENCDNCASVNVSFIERPPTTGRARAWPWIYKCADCRAFVGCHDKSNIPLGRMANGETRRLRAIAHEAFDPIWESGLLNRERAYAWLARQLNVNPDECHISWLFDEQLRMVAQVSADYLQQNVHKAEKRQQKRHESRKLERRKEYVAIKQRKRLR